MIDINQWPVKKLTLIVLFLALIGGGVLIWQTLSSQRSSADSYNANGQGMSNTNTESAKVQNDNINTAAAVNSGLKEMVVLAYQSPLDRPGERITKKPFGIKITPATSPVQPERFSGYHTGVDFEIFEDELDRDVLVNAFCNGPLVQKTTASGYGGVAVQRCTVDDQTVTVVYGHLALSSVSMAVNDNLSVGDTVGLLGADKSADTDGERKHLHFGIHKGSVVDLKGYVQSESELDNWLDPEAFL